MMKSVLMVALVINIGATIQAKALELKALTNVSEFTNLTPQSLAAGTVYYQYTAQPPAFTDWMASSKTEYEYLGLFDGYTEPQLLTPREQNLVTEKLTMFIARAKAVVNKSPSSLDLSKLVSIDFIQKLDSELIHTEISPSQIMPLVAGSGNVTAFKQCNTESDVIVRPTLEQSLASLNRPNQSWCSDSSRSICIESCYLFNSGYQAAVGAYNTFKAEDELDKKDQGMATQSELRYYMSEAEMGKSSSIADLTGVSSKIVGVLEQNIFYFNQLIQYGKMLVVFQEHPSDSTKTIVSTFVVFAPQTKTWVKDYSVLGISLRVNDILMGNGGNLNTATGITAGLPVYAKDLSMSLVKLLEN